MMSRFILLALATLAMLCESQICLAASDMGEVGLLQNILVARGSGTGEYVEVNMSLRMAAELKSGRRPRGTRLAAMVVFV